MMHSQLQVKRRAFDDDNYAIGSDPNRLSSLRRMDIPVPDQPLFSPASVYYDRADGSRVGDGYISAQWIWDVISQQKLQPILEYLGGADWARVYIRTARRDGTYPNPRTSFAVYYCVMHKPVLSGREGSPIARSPYTFQTVSIRFKDLELQSGYL